MSSDTDDLQQRTILDLAANALTLQLNVFCVTPSFYATRLLLLKANS
jgi:hypothetical protein